MSWGQFFNMGGYALYIWGSYGLALIAIAIEILFLVNRKRTLRKKLSLILNSTPSRSDETAS